MSQSIRPNALPDIAAPYFAGPRPAFPQQGLRRTERAALAYLRFHDERPAVHLAYPAGKE